MNWKVLAVIVAIALFILFGGINLTKAGFNLTKTEISKLNVDVTNFVNKNQLAKNTNSSPQDQLSTMGQGGLTR